jgi:release factor glutamine methyltransferase
MPELATLSQAFVAAAGALRRAGLATAELDARLLLCHATGLSHEAYISRARETLHPDAATRFDEAIARRLAREPVARITGNREFYGRDFIVGPGALDPRPDTETIIEAALDLVTEKGWLEKPLKLLDLGTGTGCILVTLLAELPRAQGLGTDASAEALTFAAANARRHRVSDRAQLVAGDWLDAVSGKFDLILSNPPYLATEEIAGLEEEVVNYDPQLALDGGGDGLGAYRRIAARVRDFLTADGTFLVEIGPTQGAAVVEILAAAGLSCAGSQSIRLDLAGRPRVVVAGS